MKLYKLVTSFIEKLCAVLMIVMVVVTFIQVINRLVFHGAFYWAEASVLLSMLWVAFLGSVVAIGRRDHTRIDFCINLLPAKAKRVAETIDDLICAVAAGCLAYYSIYVVKVTSQQISLELGVPKSIYTCAVLVGGCAMALYFVISAIRRWLPEQGPEMEVKST